MPDASKQSGVRDINSFNQRFKTSIIKLTLLYVGILVGILFVSSSVLYSAFSKRLEHRYRGFSPAEAEIVLEPGQPPRITYPTPDDVRADLIYSLILVNGFLLFIASALSYRLAAETLKPLKDAYEREKRFLGDASHELRTPLAILQADLENELLNVHGSKIAHARASSNLEEVKRMGSLISGLLTLSRLSEDGIKSKSIYVDINIPDFIQDICKRLSAIAEQQHVALTFEKPENPMHIFSNEKLISEAVTNVIKNAILYNKMNGTVTVSLVEKDNAAEITVADTGIGMSKKDLDKVFDRFYRVDKSRSRQTGGSGLGLAIVRSSIEQAGGTISLESELDKGTTVKLRIPL